MIKIIKKPTDPIATRVSLGGIEGNKNYLVYRGKRGAVINILREGLKAMEEMEEEPDLDYSEFDA